jgi:penicillin-binding protein 1A
MPEGWVPPDPVGDLMGQVEDPYGGEVVAPVDPNAGEPYDGGAQPQQAPAPRQPQQPQTPRREDQPQRLETLPAEKRSDPLFF